MECWLNSLDEFSLILLLTWTNKWHLLTFVFILLRNLPSEFQNYLECHNFHSYLYLCGWTIIKTNIHEKCSIQNFLCGCSLHRDISEFSNNHGRFLTLYLLIMQYTNLATCKHFLFWFSKILSEKPYFHHLTLLLQCFNYKVYSWFKSITELKHIWKLKNCHSVSFSSLVVMPF